MSAAFAMGSGGELRTRPVSYTHLDVYKRQGTGRFTWRGAYPGGELWKTVGLF